MRTRTGRSFRRPATLAFGAAFAVLALIAGPASSAEAIGVLPSPSTLHLVTHELGHPVTGHVTLKNHHSSSRRLYFGSQPAGSQFSVDHSACPETLGRNASCQVTVTFTATHWGQVDGGLNYFVGEHGGFWSYGSSLVGEARKPSN